MGADTKANTLGGWRTPARGDLRLLEDGGERGGALVSDVVVRRYCKRGAGWDR